MSKKKNQGPDTLEQLEFAKRNADAAKARLDSTLVALQTRLKPANLANEAWTGVKDTTSDLTDSAVEGVKKRPVAVGAAVSVLTLFLARKPLTRAVTRLLFSEEQDEGRVTTTIPTDKEKLDLATPVVDLTRKGVLNGQDRHDQHDRLSLERERERIDEQPRG